MHRQFILKLLENYQTDDQLERQMHKDLTQFVQQHDNCFDRELAVGHITGSAWLVDKNLGHVFFTHHKKLDKWFQPGGHSDGNANTLAVAMKEASEESGIEDVFIQPLSDNIFDIDIHTIPARKSEAEHLHYDIRFILETDINHPLNISDESHEIAWIALDDIPKYTKEESIQRMVKKMKAMKSK